VGLLKPYERDDAQAEPEVHDEQLPKGQSPKKGAPTPKRNESEAERKARLNPVLTKKEVKAKERELRRVEQAKEWDKIENTPSRVLMRDWVDSRRGISSFAMPLIMVMLLFTLIPSFLTGMLPTETLIQVTQVVMYATWLVMLAIVVDLFFMWRGFKKIAADRIPDTPLKGLLSYGISRSINIRRWRQPAARVKPGDKI
jgi:hypothetical protein